MRGRNDVHEAQDGVLRAVGESVVAADTAAGCGRPDQDGARGCRLATDDAGVHRLERQAYDDHRNPDRDGGDHILGSDEGETPVPERHPQREGSGQRATEEEAGRVAPIVACAIVPSDEQAVRRAAANCQPSNAALG